MGNDERGIMTPGDAVKAVLSRMGYSQADYARAAGVATATVSNRLKADMRASSLADMLDFAGYSLVAVPKGAKLPDGCYEIGQDERQADERPAKRQPVDEKPETEPQEPEVKLTSEQAAAFFKLYAEVFNEKRHEGES